MIAVTNVRVPMDGEIVDGRTVLVEEGMIAALLHQNEEIPARSAVLEGRGNLLMPGMIEVHIHGASGHDMTDGEVESVLQTSLVCARTGVTGFLATSLTSSLTDLLKMIESVKRVQGQERGARILGMHIEGPYLNEKRKGMQNPQFIRHPDPKEMETVLAAADGLIKMVTLAPELPNADALIDMLVARGIIASVGHSDATYEEASAAFLRGMKHVTHCFNALRPIHQRDPGALVAAMEHSDVICEAIVDHVHLHPAIVRLLHRNKGNQGMILITDAMQAMGVGDGEYMFGGHPVRVENGVARLADGSLASSTITMNKALQKTVECGISLPDAITMATETPARMLGLNKGRVAPGCDADLVLLDSEYAVRWTMIEGRVVYQAAST